MKAGSNITHAKGQLTLFLVLCALVVRLLVPAGWMPGASGSGLSLNWCGKSGIGIGAPAEARALLADAMGGKPAKPATPSDKPCAFASAAQPLGFAAQPQIAPPRVRPEPVRSPTPAAFPGRGLAAPPPLSTGPPLLA